MLWQYPPFLQRASQWSLFFFLADISSIWTFIPPYTLVEALIYMFRSIPKEVSPVYRDWNQNGVILYFSLLLHFSPYFDWCRGHINLRIYILSNFFPKLNFRVSNYKLCSKNCHTYGSTINLLSFFSTRCFFT